MPSSDADAPPTGLSLTRELHFPTPLIHGDVPRPAALNATLAAAVRAERAAAPGGLHRSNAPGAGGWHSATDLHRRPAFQGFARSVLAVAAQAFDRSGYDPATEPLLDGMWANVNPPGAHNRTHVHPHVLWSGVYYVQTPPDCGCIVFRDPRAAAAMQPPALSDAGRARPDAWTELRCEAVAGRVILFPAWLPHEVETNATALTGMDAERISISFNLRQVARRGSAQA